MREQQPGLGFQTSGDRRDQGPSSAGAEEKQTSRVIISKPRGREAGYTEHYTSARPDQAAACVFDFLPAGGWRTLKHAGTWQYASGLVQSEYVVV
jgi:hypothetical protein